MQVFDELTGKNFLLYAANNYDNPGCVSMDEFHADLSRFKYINRLLRRFAADSGDLQHRLILNHIICAANVFGVRPAVRMLLFKTDGDCLGCLRPFLEYLDYLPEPGQGFPPQMQGVESDPSVRKALEKV